MKKIVCLMLALTLMFAFISCNDDGETESPDKAFFEAVAATKPSKIKTQTYYTLGENSPLNGDYTTVITETGFVFEYSYQRYATLDDAGKENLKGNIVTESGKIYFKDNQYSFDNENWFSETPDVNMASIKLNISPEALGEYEINDAKTKVSATLTADAAEALLGIKLAAASDVSVSIETNGKYLTLVTVTYTTANATVVINTSYS